MGSEREAAVVVPLDEGEARIAQATPAETGEHVPPEPVHEPLWREEPQERATSSFGWPGALAIAVLLVWSAFFGWAHRNELGVMATPTQWADWIVAWSVPVLLVIALWLAAARRSSGEAARYSEAAQALASDSAQLEQQLARVNRELDLTRQTMAAQARELDAIGRTASETLSQNAERLQLLIRTNGEEVTAVAQASTAALANMTRLQEDLPAIASSAREAAGQISDAGNLAREQVAELGAGLGRLAEAGQANEDRMGALREQVSATIAEFNAHSSRLGEIADQRFAHLAEMAATFRADMDAREEEAFAALQHRADALRSELESRREDFAATEQAATEAFAQRLATLSEEAAGMAERLRANEALAEESWTAAIASFDHRMREAIEHISELDRMAMEKAQERLAALAEEAARIDAAATERLARFEAAREEREAAAAAHEAAALAALRERLDHADTAIAERRERHLTSIAELSRREESLADRLADLAAQVNRLVHQGRDTQDRLEDAAQKLAMRLGQSRGMIDEGHEALKRLTGESTRLLELVETVTHHGKEELPDALGTAQEQLGTLAAEASALRDLVETTGERGAGLVASMESARGNSAVALEQLAALDDRLGSASARSAELADITRGELTESIAALDRASSEVLTKLRDEHSGAVRHLAEQLGAQSADALEQALRAQMEQSLTELRDASLRAGETGRETAQQLRERVAEVEALTSALEQRIAQARARAAEPSEQEFARRMAQIAESLNSASVDLSRVFAGEVSDTDWQAYLRGDRGIFTRRTLRLLDRKETRAVAEIYQENGEFRAAVNRYVHDFEAMLRDMLSTRDGHTLAVTLLSSDVGKLYVALAQATERERD